MMRGAWLLLVVCFQTLPSTPILAQDSLNTTVLGHLDSYTAYSDIWGYQTQLGVRYAILGTQTGTSIVDITNPSSPSEVLFVPGPNSSWRDMKTHAGHAYIVTEGGGGVQVVDLEATPPVLVNTWSGTFSSAHNIAIDDGYAYVVGTDNGTRFLSLADPVNPVDVGGLNGFYIHDAIVRDDTLYAAAINSDMIAVVDVTNKAAPSTVTSWTWESSNAHNCDLTADGDYLLTTDEVTGGDLHIFDIRDLDNVTQVATWTANPSAIIHNVLVSGDLAIVSYYTEGVRILDIANPEVPVEVGYYDTYPGASGGFNGCWGVYPDPITGQIYASDIQTGLYVLEFDPAYGAVEGTVSEQGMGPIQATVSLLGGSTTQTSASGLYKLFSDPGPATLVASAFGFEPDTSMVVLTQGNVVQNDIELSRLPSSMVVGTIVSATDSMPLESVSVMLNGTPLLVQSDVDGDYQFDFVPHGVYTMAVSRFGYAPEQKTVTVGLSDPLQPLRFDLQLQPASLEEDFENGPGGWTAGDPGDTATTGLWVWVDPVGSGGGAVQPEDDHSEPGTLCWVTGNAANPSLGIGTNDVDGGQTTLTTPIFDTSVIPNATISYWRWFSNDAGAVGTPDTLRVDITSNGFTWVPVERVVTSSQWTQVTFRVDEYVTPSFLTRVRFIAEDVGSGSVVEAALDDFMVFEGQTVTDAHTPQFVTRLLANVPNPFNPSTTLRVQVAAPTRVQLRIYDIRGRLVKAFPVQRVGAGLFQQPWNGLDDRGRAVASGVYFYEMTTPEGRQARRMHLLK